MNRENHRRLVVSAWVTLDGVCDATTMDQWFNPFHSDERAEEIQHVILGSDALVLGRATYAMLAAYWSKMTKNEMGIADRLNSAPKYVVSKTLNSASWNNSTVIRNAVTQEVAKLKQRPGRNILIPGSATLVESLMPAALIDEYRFLVHPVVAGTGKRFFSSATPPTTLKLTQHKSLSHGVMLLCYEPNGR